MDVEIRYETVSSLMKHWYCAKMQNLLFYQWHFCQTWRSNKYTFIKLLEDISFLLNNLEKEIFTFKKKEKNSLAWEKSLNTRQWRDLLCEWFLKWMSSRKLSWKHGQLHSSQCLYNKGEYLPQKLVFGRFFYFKWIPFKKNGQTSIYRQLNEPCYLTDIFSNI